MCHAKAIIGNLNITKGAFSLLSLLFIGSGANAEIYEISPMNSGSASNRFESIEAFKVKVDCLKDGDKLLFERGYNYSGHLILSNCGSGTFEIGAFGKGAAPILTNSVTSQELNLDWELVPEPMFNGKSIPKLKGKPIYRIGPLPKGVRQLFYYGVRMDMARSPNREKGEDRYYPSKTISDRSPTVCQAAACIRGYEGSDISLMQEYGRASNTFAVIRNSEWSLKRSDITGHSTLEPSFAIKDSLRAPVTGDKMPSNGNGFILFNLLPFLDTEKEWYYNPEDKYLYFWPPPSYTSLLKNSQNMATCPALPEGFPGPTDADRPLASQAKILFESDESVIHMVNSSMNDLSVTISDIEFEMAPANAIKVVNASGLTVQRVKINNAEHGGVKAQSLKSAKILSSRISNTGGDGVTAYNVHSIESIDSTYICNGTLASQPTLDMAFNGLRAGGYGELRASGNSFRNSGYAAINLGVVQEMMYIGQNEISGYCLLLNDCGGIYINGQKQAQFNKLWIIDNKIGGGYGNISGGHYDVPLVSAVYLDHGMSGVKIYNNVIYDSNSLSGAIYLHGGDANIIRDNTVNASRGQALYFNRMQPPIYPAIGANNRIFHNTFTTSDIQHPVILLKDSFTGSLDDFDDNVVFENNLIHSRGGKELKKCLGSVCR